MSESEQLEESNDSNSDVRNSKEFQDELKFLQRTQDSFLKVL